ncbi:hypothetical protein CVT26_013160, partial [Gymnopilus dilepis]
HLSLGELVLLLSSPSVTLLQVSSSSLIATSNSRSNPKTNQHNALPSLLSLSPLSLLLLLVASAAIPPTTSTETITTTTTGAELTPAHFHPSIAQGLWFVEHFSPYCGHFKHFKPTWEQLVREGEAEMPGVRMGTVDCVMHTANQTAS